MSSVLLALAKNMWENGQKNRMTALVACSAIGDKLKFLVVGRSAKPRAFQGFKFSGLGVIYTNKKKAWMTVTYSETG